MLKQILDEGGGSDHTGGTLRDGTFTDIQKNNRFVQPKADRYSYQNRMESMNKKWKPELL